MKEDLSNISSLLHSAGGDLFAARIVLFNLNTGVLGTTLDSIQQDQINKLRLLLDQTAETLSKITNELNQHPKF
jgi:hypothetical protein